MSATTTMTIRVPLETKERLDRLSQNTRRSRSFLAAEAVTRYVESEADIVDGILRGIEDMKEGRTVSHEDAMDELQAIVDEARRAKQ